ncbi:hypothetical protein NEMIN01_2223 [Nematocida minor]|uniref:uncharacterized protein n=1 Tax=Nematocida minor TaxID=1912983 RepID=UPI0022205EF7|nr:uncharacterized protein NEMIN01_2223 [Nematocida minor]KAI5192800.1 hypothetical protein NEMIN01_2223 [Nematocida minor]
MSYSKCANTLNKVKRKMSTDGVKTYHKVYALLTISQLNQYDSLIKEALECLLSIYKERRGAGLFVSGEFLTYFIENLGDIVVDSDKQCIKEVLGVEISRAPRIEVERKEFKELEPAFKSRSGAIRGGRGSERKKIREARARAKTESREHTLKKRKDDKEYAEKLQRMEQAMRKQ